MRKIPESLIENFEYEDDKYSEVLIQAEKDFNLKFCENNMENTHISCLIRREHDGTKINDIEFAVGLYDMGASAVTKTIEIGLITDGFTTGYFMTENEGYLRGLSNERIFRDKCRIVETIEGNKKYCWHGTYIDKIKGGYILKKE